MEGEEDSTTDDEMSNCEEPVSISELVASPIKCSGVLPNSKRKTKAIKSKR